MKSFSSIIVLLIVLTSCSKDNNDANNTSQNNLVIKFKFDPTQERLNNLGQPANIASGNAAQSPSFAKMSANYIEFAQTATTLLGEGEIIFNGEETEAGGSKAIDFQKAKFAGNNEMFITIPLNEVSVGNYKWVRVSLAYQEGNIDFLLNGTNFNGTLASFVGYNNYITSFDLNGSSIVVNENKKQGFWAFESLGFSSSGQAPEGATTVPNPLFNTSPIPQGSCVVTGEFENGLLISGNETEDVEVILSFSVNNSFEWIEVNADGKFEPNAGEMLVDMGLRGLIPIVN
ncbi:hypothetical protein [uncultured Algibacter sp.]|uniref:hypothetical protein n=1 Tax=uncultured Algibacter sp. TaxID=298659 RepID=UPI0026304841|nr:hypothetical protein [uncultured Algibacter sp.]